MTQVYPIETERLFADTQFSATFRSWVEHADGYTIARRHFDTIVDENRSNMQEDDKEAIVDEINDRANGYINHGGTEVLEYLRPEEITVLESLERIHRGMVERKTDLLTHTDILQIGSLTRLALSSTLKKGRGTVPASDVKMKVATGEMRLKTLQEHVTRNAGNVFSHSEDGRTLLGAVPNGSALQIQNDIVVIPCITDSIFYGVPSATDMFHALKSFQITPESIIDTRPWFAKFGHFMHDLASKGSTHLNFVSGYDNRSVGKIEDISTINDFNSRRQALFHLVAQRVADYRIV